MFNEVSGDSARKAVEHTDHFQIDATLPLPMERPISSCNTKASRRVTGLPQSCPVLCCTNCFSPLTAALPTALLNDYVLISPVMMALAHMQKPLPSLTTTLSFLTTKTSLGSLTPFNPLVFRLEFGSTGQKRSAGVLSPSQLSNLRQALSSLDGASSEVQEGTQFLGAPLGSPTFATRFLEDAALTFSKRTHRLASRLGGKQTVAMLYKLCAFRP
jgi:hypothetical protein